MKVLDYILLFFKGMISGIANVIPGVSGGTMAFILGVYDHLTEAIGNVVFEFRQWKKTRRRLLYIGVFGGGSAVSFWIFANILNQLLNQDLSRQFTCLFFIGLIIGSIPYVIKMHTDMKINFKRIGLLLIAFSAVVALSVFSSQMKVADGVTAGFNGEIEMTPLYAFWLFITGVLSAGSMVLPGFSGSALLISLGEYYNMIHYSADLVNGLLVLEFRQTAALYMLFMCLGTPVGMIFIAKLINKLLKKFPSETYYFIVGLLVASIYQIYTEIQNTLTINTSALLISILCLAAGFIAAYGMSKIKKT